MSWSVNEVRALARVVGVHWPPPCAYTRLHFYLLQHYLEFSSLETKAFPPNRNITHSIACNPMAFHLVYSHATNSCPARQGLKISV